MQNEKVNELAEIMMQIVSTMHEETKATKETFGNIFFCLEEMNKRIGELERSVSGRKEDEGK